MNCGQCVKRHHMVTHHVLANVIGDEVGDELSGFGLYISHGKGQKTLFYFSCTVNLAGREESRLCVSGSLHCIPDLL